MDKIYCAHTTLELPLIDKTGRLMERRSQWKFCPSGGGLALNSQKFFTNDFWQIVAIMIEAFSFQRCL